MRIVPFLLLFMTHISFAQKPFFRDLWLADPGMPLQVSSIADDASGGFSLATKDGLLYFDGRKATSIDKESKNITATINTRDQLVYGCADGSVFRLGTAGRELLFKAKAPVLCLLETGAGLFAGTEGDGIYLLTSFNRSLLHYTVNEGLPDNYVYSLTEENGRFLIGTDVDFFRGWLHGGKLHFEEVKHFGDITRVVKENSKTKGNVWLGFQERGVAVLDSAYGGKAIVVSFTDDTTWKWGQVNDIVPVNSRESWIGTQDGWLLHATVTGTGKNHVNVDTVLSIGRPIYTLKKDYLDNIWMGTDIGLTQVTTGYLYAVALPGAFNLGKLTATATNNTDKIYYDQEDELWTYDIRLKKNYLMHKFKVPINCIYVDKVNNLWLGTSGDGLWLYKHSTGTTGTASKVLSLPGLADAYFLSISGTKGHMWLSTLNGVDEVAVDEGYKLNAIAHHGKLHGLGSDIVYQIYTDKRSRTWFATDGAGISMYDGHNWNRWGAEHGFNSGVVYSVIEDVKGQIWAATLKDGILKLSGNRWHKLNKRAGLTSETITSLATDSSGRIYAVSGTSIDEWDPTDNAFKHVNNKNVAGLDSFSTALNLTVRIGNDIYYPYKNGFLKFAGRTTHYNTQVRISITETQLYFEKLAALPGELNYDQNHLTFRFRGINFVHADRLHYRYKLIGYSNDWINTADEFVTFPRLTPGSYKFIVQASLDERFENPAEVKLQFVIKAPFWLTWWFWAIVAIVVFGTTYLAVRWRITSVQKLAKMEQEKLTFEYEHLKSQVNPHFLFNSLNALAALIEESPSAAVDYTEQLSELYRNVLEEHNEPLISITEEWVMLERYCYVQKTRFQEALQIRDKTDREFKDKKKVVPLALQLLVENAIKHNVVSRSAPLEIIIEADDNWLVVRNFINEKKHKEKSMGLGLKNIRRRYKLVTKIEVQTYINNHEFIVKLPLL